MAMNLYACTFKWLINKINQRIKGSDLFSSIGVLDIFGFENFDVSFQIYLFIFSFSRGFLCIDLSTRRNLYQQLSSKSPQLETCFCPITRLTGLSSSISTTPTKSFNSISTSTSFLWNSMSTTGI